MGARGMCEKSIEPDSQCTCYGYGCEVRLTRGGGYEFAAENVAAQPQKKQFPAGIVSFNCQRICAVYNFLKFHRGSLFSAPPSGGFCPISHLLNMLNYDIFQAELHSPQTKRQNVNKTQKTQIYKEREGEREPRRERERYSFLLFY